MDNLTHYKFRSVWTVDATAADVFDVLRDIATYPAWWPEIKQARRIDDDRVEVRVRSVLPYDLWFEMKQTTADAEAGVLEVALKGELEGFSRFTIVGSDTSSTILIFEEEVDTHKETLNRLAPVARPAFKANHALMMRHGETGLRSFLAGMGFAREKASAQS
jgi:hypothetical protein